VALQPATPEWNWLAAPDERAAWVGVWPGTNLPLRVEAAAKRGKPVAFQAIGPWSLPSRTPEAAESGETALTAITFALVLSVLLGGATLAIQNLREGRGDRRGALSLTVAGTAALWALWLCEVHLTASAGFVAMFLLAVVTTVFYGVLFCGLYLALEPVVRRVWPQTLVSWTTLLSGRARDPVVGRDALFGTAVGVSIALLVRAMNLYQGTPSWGDSQILFGGRAVGAFALTNLIYAVRSALFFFFLLFGLRLLVRNQRAAAVLFAAIFAVTNGLGSNLLDAVGGFVYFSMLAAAVLRWGLTTLACALLVANLLLNVPATDDMSAWYFSSTLLVMVIPIALAAWASYTSLRPKSRALS
jgi:hypothetical protein